MVCSPRPYSNEKTGGYLLNNEKYFKGLFIDKHAYAYNSILQTKNDIYDMVNKISSTPFKINKDLLNYLNHKGIEQDLIVDTKEKT